MHAEASLFWNGRSQAVRLPKEMRPFEKEWTTEFWNCLGQANGEFKRPDSVEQIARTLNEIIVI